MSELRQTPGYPLSLLSLKLVNAFWLFLFKTFGKQPPKEEN